MPHAGSWQEDERGLPPLIATLAGCALLVVAALLLPRLIAPPPLPVLLSAGAAAGLLLWGIAFAVEVRHAPFWWKLASLALLVALGLLGGLLIARADNARMTYDASSFAEAEIERDGSVKLPADSAERGPVSRSAGETFAAIADAEGRYAKAATGANYGALNSPYQLSQSPGVLEECGAIGALQEDARNAHRETVEHTAALVATVEASELAPAIRRGVAMMAAPRDAAAEAAWLDSRLAMLDSTQALCRLLARGSWVEESGRFGFRNAADRAAYDEITERRREASSVSGKIHREAIKRRTLGQEIVREALSG